MVKFIQVLLNKIYQMELVIIFGIIKITIMVSSQMEKDMDLEFLDIAMEDTIKEIFTMIKRVVKVNNFIKIVCFTWDHLKMI